MGRHLSVVQARLSPAASPRALGYAVPVWARICLLGLGVGLTRLPFLAAGFGLDPDAHRLALSAAAIRKSGTYVMSREPGHPVQEWVSSWVVASGPVAVNGLTALMSCVTVVFFALFLRDAKVKSPFALACVLALSQSFFVHSTDAMDFVWAMAMGWASLYFAYRGRFWPSALLLGLGMGCRVTEAITFIPLAILYARGAKKRTTMLTRMALGFASAAIGLTCYLPVFRRYGSAALRVYDSGETSLSVVVSRLFLESWGPIGLCLLAVGILLLVWERVRERGLPRTCEPRDNASLRASALAAITLTLALFLRLPHDAGYLLPAVPWVLFLVGKSRPSWQLALAAASLGVGSLSIPALGSSSVCSVQERRVEQTEKLSALVAHLRTLTEPTLIVAGTYQPKILAAVGSAPLHRVTVAYLADAEALSRARERHQRILYLRRARAMNLRHKQIDLREVGGRELNF